VDPPRVESSTPPTPTGLQSRIIIGEGHTLPDPKSIEQRSLAFMLIEQIQRSAIGGLAAHLGSSIRA